MGKRKKMSKLNMAGGGGLQSAEFSRYSTSIIQPPSILGV
jgi:hypothetical protein